MMRPSSPISRLSELLTELGVEGGGFVAASFSQFHAADTAEKITVSIAALLDGIVATTGLDVVLIAHLGTFGSERTHDCAFHDSLVEAAKSDRITAAPMLSSRETAWLTRQAAMVVSTRYHPVVFGISAGIPTVGIALDAYTENKVRGALALVGMEGWCVSILGLSSGVVAEAVDEAWRRRAAITESLTRRLPRLEEDKARYWDAVSLAIARKPIPSPASSDDDEPGLDGAVPDGDWTVRNDDAVQWTRLSAARTGDLQREYDSPAAQVRTLADELERERLARCAALDEVEALTGALVVERAGREAAQRVNAEILDWANDQPLPADLIRETARSALRRTGLAGPARFMRSVYRAVRRDKQG